MRPKLKIRFTWFNDTETHQRIYLDTMHYCAAQVKKQDCEVLDLELDKEFPELMVKIWPNGNVLLTPSAFTYNNGRTKR